MDEKLQCEETSVKKKKKKLENLDSD